MATGWSSAAPSNGMAATSVPGPPSSLRTFGPSEAPVHLVCVPHSGAGASAYASWRRLLPTTVALHAVQLPGREDRWDERPYQAVDMAADQLVTQVLAGTAGRPYVLFGHSMGGLLGYALALRSQALGRPAAHVVVSGCQPSDQPTPRRRMGHLKEEEFVAELAEHGGLPREIASTPGILELFLPTLRADVRMAEAYTPPATPRLTCPLTAFGSDTDIRVPWAGVEEWRRYTAAKFAAVAFPGSHMFVTDARRVVVAAIAAIVDGVMR